MATETEVRPLSENVTVESYDEESGRLVIKPTVGCNIYAMAAKTCKYFEVGTERLAEIGISKLTSVEFDFNVYHIVVTAKDATSEKVVGMWESQVEESRERDRRALARAAAKYGEEFPTRVEQMLEDDGSIVTELHRVSPNEIVAYYLEAGYVPRRSRFWLDADGSIS